MANLDEELTGLEKGTVEEEIEALKNEIGILNQTIIDLEEYVRDLERKPEYKDWEGQG